MGHDDNIASQTARGEDSDEEVNKKISNSSRYSKTFSTAPTKDIFFFFL